MRIDEVPESDVSGWVIAADKMHFLSHNVVVGRNRSVTGGLHCTGLCFVLAWKLGLQARQTVVQPLFVYFFIIYFCNTCLSSYSSFNKYIDKLWNCFQLFYVCTHLTFKVC